MQYYGGGAGQKALFFNSRVLWKILITWRKFYHSLQFISVKLYTKLGVVLRLYVNLQQLQNILRRVGRKQTQLAMVLKIYNGKTLFKL